VAAALVPGLVAPLVAAGAGFEARRLRRSIGLDEHLDQSHLLVADDSDLGVPTLRSERLGLTARPDQLVRLHDGAVIPVEHKPGARRLLGRISPWRSGCALIHVMQTAQYWP
jgi:hypothetical protein